MKMSPLSKKQESPAEQATPEKRAAKLKSLMALFSIQQIHLHSKDSAANIFEFDDCWDSMGKVIEPASPEIPTLAAEIVNELTEKEFEEIADMEHGEGSAEIELVGSKMRVMIDIPYDDYKERQVDGELDGDESPENEIVAGLSQYGITKVNIDYSGSGDSGSFGVPQFFREEALIPNASVEQELITKIEDYIYELADANFDNEGSSGEAQLFLREGVYNFEICHRDYIGETLTIEENF